MATQPDGPASDEGGRQSPVTWGPSAAVKSGSEDDFDVGDDDELTDDPELRRSVPIRGFAEFLVHDVKREFTYRSLILFLCALVLITVNACMMFPIAGVPEDYYVTTAVSKDLIKSADFKNIRTPSAFYTWLRSLKTLMWVPDSSFNSTTTVLQTHALSNGLPAERQNIPLYYMVIRQHRVQSETCGGSKEASPILQTMWAQGNQKCFPEYRRNRLTSTSYRPAGTTAPFLASTTDPFLNDGTKTGASQLPSLQTARGEDRKYYDAASNQFTVVLPYQSLSQENVESVIADLEGNNWIDHATRMIVVETVFFNPQAGMYPPHGVYTGARLTLEFHYSGLPMQKVWLRPFRFMFLGEWSDGLCFGFDILLLLYVPWLARDVVWHVWMGHKFQPWADYFGLVEGLSLAHMLLLFIALVYRFIIWADSDTFSSNLSSRDFYDKVLDYQETFEYGRNWYIAALWITWVRVLEFLRYNARLNAVTETVRLAATDLFSLLVVTSIVLLTFALIGSSLYGRHVEAFATLGDSMDFLLRTIFTADIEGADYTFTNMKDVEPAWTPFYVLMFFGLSWLILLNVVLGILATGFSAASQSTTDRSWDLPAIRLELFDFVRTRFGEDRESCVEFVWPFSSKFFDRRVQAARHLHEELQAVQRQHDEQQAVTPKGQRWKQKPFDPNGVRRTKGEVMRMARLPHWGLRRSETSRSFDECLEWWRGNLSDIASQQQSERDELRGSVSDLAQRISIMSARTDERFAVLEKHIGDNATYIMQDMRTSGAGIHGRHDRHQRTLEEVLAKLGVHVGGGGGGGGPPMPPPPPPAPAVVQTPPEPTPAPADPAPPALPGNGTPAEALYRGEWLPCSLLAQRTDGLYLIAWSDGTWTDGVQAAHIRARGGAELPAAGL